MEKEITGQKKIVLEIVQQNSPIMTQTVKILAMRQGVSCGARYLRWLQQSGEIFSQKNMGNKTKTWYAVKSNEVEYQAAANGQLVII